MNVKIDFALPGSEWLSVLKGTQVAGIGIVLVYLLEHLLGFGFGNFSPIMVGIMSVLANIVRKSVVIETNTPDTPPTPPGPNDGV